MSSKQPNTMTLTEHDRLTALEHQIKTLMQHRPEQWFYLQPGKTHIIHTTNPKQVHTHCGRTFTKNQEHPDPEDIIPCQQCGKAFAHTLNATNTTPTH